MPRSFLVRGRPQANLVPVDKSAAPAQTRTIPGEQKNLKYTLARKRVFYQFHFSFKKIVRVVRTEVRI